MVRGGLALWNVGVNCYELCQNRQYSLRGPEPQASPTTGLRDTRPGRKK